MSKNNEKILVPKLRFPDFKNEKGWQEKSLENIATFLKGKGISKADITPNGKTPCIRYGELYTYYNEVIDSPISYTDLPISELILSKANDVIIPSSGETQEDIAIASCVLKDGIALGGDLNILRSNINGIFLAYNLTHIKKRAIAKLAQGNAVVHLYSNQLKKLQINVPNNIGEQKQIANCLSSLDEVIAAETKMLDLFQSHKRGLLQNLLPVGNENIPKYRFKEFEDYEDWFEDTLLNIAGFRRGSFPQPYGLPKWYDDENGMPFIQVYDVGEDFRLKPTTKRKISNLAAKQSVYIAKGTLIITIQGSIGRVAITQYDAYIDRTLLLFEEFYKEIDVVFFAYTIFLLFEIEKQKAPGGIIKTITKEVLSSFLVKLPDIEEQKKIASCFTSVDDLINAQSQKLEALQLHKKGLLQGLFPNLNEVTE